MRKKLKGKATIELIMVMILLVLLGTSIYQLIEMGNNTQRKIMYNKEAQIDARIAISFINVRLRQNDEKNKIELKELSLNSKNAIVFKERSEEVNYDTWIYFFDGNLYQCIVDADKEPEEIQGSVIAKVDDFNVTFDKEKNIMTSEIFYKTDSESKEEILKSEVYINSSQVGG